jgi:HAD superfamily hydrolase (TIGR01484 family)
MLPLNACPAEILRAIRVVLTDIDDTLTSDGRLTAPAYAALWRLHEAGLIVIPVTGRPAGWCDMIARFWPVDGVVGENGAFYFRYDAKNRRLSRRYAKSETERSADRERLNGIRDKILKAVPGAAIASDQAYREADLAVDFCEDVKPLPNEAIDKIVGIFRQHGATAKVSSIHVNGWFGRYDKLSMSRLFLKESFDLDMESKREQIIFVGDSPNDAPMFGFFPNAIGVANVLRFADSLPAKPAWVTAASGGAGFAEFAEFLLDAKKSTS